MNIQKCEKQAFTVIGKQGSTRDGADFIGRLWQEANAHFSEVAHLAKHGEDGSLCGIWGAMSDLSLSFAPWEDGFSQGLYLAGVECVEDAQPPEGWTRWRVPGYVFLKVENEGEETFPGMLRYMGENGLTLAGAVHDFTCPVTGKPYQFFPIQRL